MQNPNSLTIDRCQHARMCAADDTPPKEDVCFYKEDQGHMVRAGQNLIKAARLKQNHTDGRAHAADELYCAFVDLETALDNFFSEMGEVSR